MMKATTVLVATALLGACSRASSEAPPGAASVPASAAPTATVPAVAAPAVTPAAAATATAAPHPAGTAPGASPTGPAPAPTGACATLAQLCTKCPPGVAQLACNGAVMTGAINPVSCTSALADKNLQAQCGGSAPAPSATTTAAPTASGSAPPPAPVVSGPCMLLSQKCARCPAGVTQMACQAAVSGGAVDQRACINALNDPNIKAQCN